MFLFSGDSDGETIFTEMINFHKYLESLYTSSYLLLENKIVQIKYNQIERSNCWNHSTVKTN